MPLVTIKQMIYHARLNGYALGGFQLDKLDDISAVIDAAQTCHAPVLLDVGQGMRAVRDSGMLLAAAEYAARQASVPIGLVSTQLTQTSTAVNAIRDGSNGLSINLDGDSGTDKIARTLSFVQLAAGCGIPVESCVSLLGSDATLAQSYIEQTGVDVLAYSLDDEVSTLSTRQVAEKLVEIKHNVKIPIALHRTDVLTDDAVQTLREAGVALMHSTSRPPEVGTDAPYTRDAVRQYVRARMLALDCVNRATDVLNDCTRWEPVEHVIVFNVETQDGLDIDTVLARGRQVLGEIPGVRYVHTGQAVQSNAAYQFCWLVQFVHPAVIDSYREFPTHKKFADELFRPIAPTRMSIDFYLTTNSGASQIMHAPDQQKGKPGEVQYPDQLTAV